MSDYFAEKLRLQTAIIETIKKLDVQLGKDATGDIAKLVSCIVDLYAVEHRAGEL
jgi:hypothetical protein